MTNEKGLSEYRMLIGGRLEGGSNELPVVNPATGEAFASCPLASKEQAEQAISAAKTAFTKWSALPIAKRREYLLALADELENELEDFALLLTKEQGKPLPEAMWEMEGSLGWLRYFAEAQMPTNVLEESEERHVIKIRRPLGVVVGIVPWNFPMLLLHFKLPAALIAGNTIVLKPSPTTPLTTLKYGELCARVLPPGVVNIVTDNNDLGAYLTSHPDVRKISFTGSTMTGSKVMASAASELKRVTLELGGNDAAIVLDDVDPAEVAPAIYGAAFMNCGQVCIAIKRVYAHESIYDQLCDELAKIANAAKVGDGAEEGVEMGPVQNKAQFDKVLGMIENARACGSIIAGGERMDRPGYFIRPTIVRDVKDGDQIVDEEQFGPILPVLRYSDPEDALARANASTMGLGGSIWGSDKDRLADLASRMNAGTVWINKHVDLSPNIPFGGAKQSGVGVECAEEGLAEFTQIHIVNAPPVAA